MRFGPGGVWKVVDEASDEVREYAYVPWVSEHFDKVKEFVQTLTLKV